MLIQIFALYLLASGNIVEIGRFPTRDACLAIAKQDGKMFCNSQYTSDESPQYGTCWSCMHGCTREQNLKACGIDPLTGK